MKTILKATNLSKSFSGQTIADNASLNIGKNSVHDLPELDKAEKISSLKILSLLFAFVVCFSFAGCSLQDKIEEYSRNKEQCYLNIENVTQFSYKGNGYTILEDTVPDGELGEWIGYIRQLAAVDQTGKVLLQEDIEVSTFQTLSNLADKVPEAAYIIPFLNVYAAPDTEDFLVADVNGEHHKAVRDEKIKSTDTVFRLKGKMKSESEKFEINPENATQLLCGDKIYQITPDTVSNDELGNYIDILAESITFDPETKCPLSKDDLNRIDWNGDSSGQEREQWFYTDIYEISGTDITEAVAVKINNCCHVARRQ